MNATDSSIIQVIVRASAVLDCFTRGKTNMTINELAGLTNLNKGTIYRILATMQSIGWIDQDKATKKYHLGMGLFRLGSSVKSSMLIASVARPILEDIHRRCDETVLLQARYGDELITLDCIVGTQFVRAAGDVGDVSPFSFDVICICLLAYMSDEDIRRVLPGLTEEGFARLKDEIAAVHMQGYAIAAGKRYPEALGIGAPIFNDVDECIAQLCLYGPLYRVTNKRDECISAIIDGANRISQRLCSPTIEKGHSNYV